MFVCVACPLLSIRPWYYIFFEKKIIHRGRGVYNIYSCLRRSCIRKRKLKCDASQSNSLFVTCTASVSHAYVRLIGQRHTSAFASVMRDLVASYIGFLRGRAALRGWQWKFRYRRRIPRNPILRYAPRTTGLNYDFDLLGGKITLLFQKAIQNGAKHTNSVINGA